MRSSGHSGMDVLSQGISLGLDSQFGEGKLTACLVFMESSIVAVSVGTECGRQRPPGLIVRVTVIVLVDGDFRRALGHCVECTCGAVTLRCVGAGSTVLSSSVLSAARDQQRRPGASHLTWRLSGQCKLRSLSRASMSLALG